MDSDRITGNGTGDEEVAVRDWSGALKEGTKNDTGKLRYDLIPIDAQREFVKVLTFGASKYEDRNWEKGIKYSRCYAALQRHLTSFWDREDNDPETNLKHLAHAICCASFLLSYQLRGMQEFDDRPPTSPLSSRSMDPLTSPPHP